MARQMCAPWTLTLLSSILWFAGLAAVAAAAEPAATRIAAESPSPVTSSLISSIPVAPSPATKGATASKTQLFPGTCRSASVNHITNRLPQQCWTGTTTRPVAEASGLSNETSLSINQNSVVTTTYIIQNDAQNDTHQAESLPHSTGAKLSSNRKDSAQTVASVDPVKPPKNSSDEAEQGELDSESPLDNANFLSFEEWTKKKATEAAEKGETPSGEGKLEEQSNQHPGNNNPLESLSDDSEIAFDFQPFGNPGGEKQKISASTSTAVPMSSAQTNQAVAAPRKISKDAGKTCKERTNYASVDCAASVLKKNPKCKSESSILVENKDSYMLNECSVENKFVIVELCENVLIDTIVLANFEFFSSMFRKFRISGSSYYPPKPDQWEHMGTYEARNTREIQAFLVENPPYTKYLRVEFLTHYGSEFYCPVSLLRVHGVTMYEEFLREEQGSDQEEEEENVRKAEDVKTAIKDTAPAVSEPSGNQEREQKDDTSKEKEPSISSSISNGVEQVRSGQKAKATSSEAVCGISGVTEASRLSIETQKDHMLDSAVSTPAIESGSQIVGNATSIVGGSTPESTGETRSSASQANSTSRTSLSQIAQTAAFARNVSSTASGVADTPTSTHKGPEQTTSATVLSSRAYTVVPKYVQPAAATPNQQAPTRESFFKSIHKRLQALEVNATLSLQYIEAQSVLLRDAFAKVEKRQLTKTSTFLNTLNETVTTELARFKSDYDQLWQSAVMELASQREESRRERELLGERVKLLAEEIVNQKRLMAAQATLTLLCLGLVIFGKFGGAGPSMDSGLLQGMQEIVNKAKEAKMRDAERANHAWGWESPWPSPNSKPANGLQRGNEHGMSSSTRRLSAVGMGVQTDTPSPAQSPDPEVRRRVSDNGQSSDYAELSDDAYGLSG